MSRKSAISPRWKAIAPGTSSESEAHARQLANLVDKGEVFRRAIVLPPVVECVRHVLGPQVKLSSLNAAGDVGFQLVKFRLADFRPCSVNDFHASDARTQTGYRTGHPLY